MNISQIKIGDVLSYWYDTGAMGSTLCYARVTKIGLKKIKVIGENGDKQSWKYPRYFNRIVSPKTVDEMRTEGSLKI